MAQFILLIREDLSKYPMDKEELNAIVKAHIRWADELTALGVFKGGNGIASDGRLIEMINGDLIVEPIRDVREGIGGYYIIEVKDLQAAIEIAKEMPTYKNGDLVEVRPLGTWWITIRL